MKVRVSKNRRGVRTIRMTATSPGDSEKLFGLMKGLAAPKGAPVETRGRPLTREDVDEAAGRMAASAAPTLRVVAAAVRDEKGVVHSLPAPARHHDVVRVMSEAGLRVMGEDIEQGFVLSDGSFCRRKPAKRIATEAGQLLPRAMNLSELYSEDVW